MPGLSLTRGTCSGGPMASMGLRRSTSLTSPTSSSTMLCRSTGDDLTEETLHRRAMPGTGEFPLGEFCARMRAHGFDGVVSVEVLSSALAPSDP